LIIGADGSGSLVRQNLFPSHPGRKVLDKTVWQISLPLDIVRNDPVLKGLLDGHKNVITVAPARSIFASPSPPQNTYDLQLIDHEYTLAQDPNPTALTERIRDLSWLKKRFSDFDPSTRKAIEVAESAFKWRLVEVFGLPSWSGGNGKVVLLGDACKFLAFPSPIFTF
jgi:salicylate hydroxylase